MRMEHPINRPRKNSVGTITKIKNIPSNYRPNRAGVIIYTIIQGKLYFCFGRDKASGDLTDFGGGVKNSDASPVQAGIRELIEESLGVFGIIYEDEVQDYQAILHNNMLLMFFPLEVNRDEVRALFEERYHRIAKPEMSELVWLSYDEIKTIVDSNNQSYYETIYHKVHSLLVDINFIYQQIVTTDTDTQMSITPDWSSLSLAPI